VVRRRREDQLVDRLVVEQLLDRVERIVARGDEAVDGDAGRVAQGGQRLIEHALRRVGLGVPLGMGRVPFGRRRVRGEEADRDRTAGGAGTQRGEHLARHGDTVGDHEDSGGSWGVRASLGG
jgi:hypothetical protein